MANRFTNPRPQFLDATPEVYAGGALFFYETGTTTKTDTYSDAALTTENTNPVVLDSAGRLPNAVFLDPNVTYKVVLAAAGYSDPPSAAIWTEDPVDDPAANATAAFQVYAGNPNGNVAGTAGTPGGSGSSVVWDITSNLLYVCSTSGTASTAVWTQVASTLSGGVQMTGVISPTALAADQDDYSPTGNTSASVIRQGASANVIITGLAGGAPGFLKTFHNIATDKTITLADGALVTSSTAANRFALGGNHIILHPGQSVDLIYDAISSRWRPKSTYPMLPVPAPGGRLTLESGVPASTSDQLSKTTLYYTPHLHGFVSLYNGTHWFVSKFSEVSQTLADTTKSPAAAAVNSVYDIFLWSDEGTLRISRGPAWSSATSRGTGAGTTELERLDGVWVNKIAINNGPAAQRGLYVGTIATDGDGANGELNMMFEPAAAAGGTNNRLDVWNMYNRVEVSSLVRDSTDTWNYATATWRSFNNSASNRVTLVLGQQEDAVDAFSHVFQSTGSGGVNCYSGIGIDSTSAMSVATASLLNAIAGWSCKYSGKPGLGRRFVQQLEQGSGAQGTFYGDNGAPSLTQSYLSVRARM